MEKWQQVVGVQAHDWGIKQMKTKWGACNIAEKRIWLNLDYEPRRSRAAGLPHHEPELGFHQRGHRRLCLFPHEEECCSTQNVVPTAEPATARGKSPPVQRRIGSGFCNRRDSSVSAGFHSGCSLPGTMERVRNVGTPTGSLPAHPGFRFLPPAPEKP